MDWYADSTDLGAIVWLRHECDAYLRRHASPESDVEGAVLAFSELTSNAAEHATGPLWVSVDWTAGKPIVSVHDLGPSFDAGSIRMPDPTQVRGRGLAIAADIAEQIEVEARVGGGTRVQAVLPVTRPIEPSYDPPRRSRGLLPELEEATSEGFGRESFLRALIVQLAQELERSQGPSVAEAAIAQVGTDVGAQMEEEFRLAREIVDAMSPEVVGECFVRLKHAIDGDFYVIEANDQQIVLGNRRCPFGEAVQHAPALCRMTSSVFGGIAARNFGEVSVMLEERIAVGDAQCRVVVDLRPDPARPGHRYSAPSNAE